NEPETEFQRVGVGGLGQFVDERFDDKAAGGMLDQAPPGAWHGRLCERVFDSIVRRLIRDERCSGELRFFRGLFALGIPHRFNGSGSLEVFTGGEISLSVENDRKFVIRSVTVKIMLYVVFGLLKQ